MSDQSPGDEAAPGYVAVDTILEIVDLLVANHGLDTQDALLWAQENGGRVVAEGGASTNISPEAVAAVVADREGSTRGTAPDLSGSTNFGSGRIADRFLAGVSGESTFTSGRGAEARVVTTDSRGADAITDDDVDVSAYRELLFQALTAAPDLGDLGTGSTGLATTSDIRVVNEDIANEWLDENADLLVTWVTSGVDLNEAIASTYMGLEEDAMEKAADLFERGGANAETASDVRILLSSHGVNAIDARRIAESTANEILTLESVYNNPDINALARSYNFADAESWLSFIRDEFTASSSEELRNLAGAPVTELWSFVDNGFIGNIADQEEALRISQRIQPFTKEGYAFTYDGGNGFVFAQDWARVSDALGLDADSPQSRRLTEVIFGQAASTFGEDATSVAPYLALLAKKNGLIENYVMPQDRPSPASTVFAALNFGAQTLSPDGLFEGATSSLAGSFQQAMERYGRPELALIAVDNPFLAERIYTNGNPANEEERHEVLRILEQYDENDLASIGFGQGFSARYVDELTTVGGAAGQALRASGATVVQQQDPEALAESYRQTYKTLLLEDPSEAEVQAFVGQIQSANRSATAAATQEILSGFNVWKGTSYGSDDIASIVERYDVNPAARQLATIRASKDYQALYRHLPTGVSEEEFVNRYRAKVGSVLGGEDVSDNLDIVRYGMEAGDANAAQRIAYGAGATEDETVRSDIAAKVRFIRGLV